MAEREFALLNPNEPRGPSDSGQGQQNNSAGFMFPYKLASGIMQGTQGVGFGGVNIDSDNNRITVGNIVLDGNTGSITIGDNISISITNGIGTMITTNADGSQNGMGLIPGTTNEFGFFATDTAGNTVWKQVGPTGTITDITNAKGIILDGKLPDGTFGTVMAKVGTEVTSVFN